MLSRVADNLYWMSRYLERAEHATRLLDVDLNLMMDEAEPPTEFLQQVMEAVHQFQGVSDSTMSHGEGWQFIQVGRYIERASATAILLEAYHEDLWGHPDRPMEGNEYLDWMGLLR